MFIQGSNAAGENGNFTVTPVSQRRGLIGDIANDIKGAVDDALDCTSSPDSLTRLKIHGLVSPQHSSSTSTNQLLILSISTSQLRYSTSRSTVLQAESYPTSRARLKSVGIFSPESYVGNK